MPRLNITFLNPPFMKDFSRPQRSPAVTKSGTLYYPMWLAYATAVADDNGYGVDLIDAPADDLDLDAVVERIKAFGPRMVVVDSSTPSIYNDAKVCARLKSELPDLFIMMVGTHVTALPEESLTLDQSIDAAAVSEYDYTVTDVAAAIESGNDISGVPGIVTKIGGKIVNTGRREFIKDLDAIPFVSRIYKRFLNIDRYFNANALPPMVTITTSRGCPYPCTFCVYPQTLTDHTMRVRSVANVVDEIEYIVSEFPEAKTIFFEDDTFTINRKRCVEIAEEIIRRDIKISGTVNARADLDLDTMTVMKQAGFRLMCVGFESGNQQLLDNIKKKNKIEKMSRFMADAKKAGLLVHGCFMVGLPGETKETMNQTLDLALRLNPDTAQFYPIMVYPGTEAYDWYKERGLLTTDDFSKWITPGGLHNTVIKSDELTPDELVSFCDHARRRFYLRPGYIAYKVAQTLTNPAEIKRNFRSAQTFIKYIFRGSDIPEKNC